MGIGGIGIWQLLIVLVIVLALFGTKKLRNLGGDLGGAIKGFKKAVNEDKSAETIQDQTSESASTESTAGATDNHTAKQKEAKKSAVHD